MCAALLLLDRGAIGADATVFARFDDKVAHAVLRIGDTTVLASDGQGASEPEFRGFSLSLTVSDDAEAERLFAALSDGGNVQVPMAPTPFASSPWSGRRQVRRAVDGRVTECDGVTYPFHSRRETTSR